MIDEDSDSEAPKAQEVNESRFDFKTFFISTFEKAKADPKHFIFQILTWIIPVYIYYLVADEFVRQSLLNLTKGRIEGLDLPFIILDEAVDPFTRYITTFISLTVVTGFYFVGFGHMTPRQYNIRVQLLGFLAALPFISYFILHIMWLKENDSSWYFDLGFMVEQAGFTLSNEWPFATDSDDTRWAFYRVGLYNAVRVVLLSIFGCTLLGIFVGVSRLSRNRMLSGLAEAYVEFFRNTPLVVQLLFLYTVFLGANLPNFSEIEGNTMGGWIFWSNRGFAFPDIVIGNQFLFISAIGIFLATRTYIRFTERLPPVESDSPPYYVPIIVDAIFSLSILITLYGVINILDWTYTINKNEADGTLTDLLTRFCLSLYEGLFEKAPFSLFMLGILLSILSALSRFKLDEIGMNKFTTDDSPEGLKKRTALWSVVFVLIILLFHQSIWFTQPNLVTEETIVDKGELIKVYDMDSPASERLIYEGKVGYLEISGKSDPTIIIQGINVEIKSLYVGGKDGGPNLAHGNNTWNLTKADCDLAKNVTLIHNETQAQVFTPKCNYVEDTSRGPPNNQWINIGTICSEGCQDGNYTWSTGGRTYVKELGWGQWRFQEGTILGKDSSKSISREFIALWIGLTLYTAAQVAEIVRGSIQSLPRGQVEAAISLGLSPFQRLKLVILPQALRSMIPSLTNQYLNCWKNSSLAIIIGFSDFYAVFTTIANNAGQAVPVFMMILLTYQAGSLTISSIMNYINSTVTKVKI